MALLNTGSDLSIRTKLTVEIRQLFARGAREFFRWTVPPWLSKSTKYEIKPRNANQFTAERDTMIEQDVSNAETLRQQLVDQDQVIVDSIVQQNVCHEQIEELTMQYHASQVKMQALKDKLDLIIEENSCPICISPWEAQGAHRLVSLRCGHLFGDNCIRQWLSRNSRCPNCRQEVEISDLRYIFGCRILLSPGQQDQAEQPNQVEQAPAIRHSPRVQQVLYNLAQLTPRLILALQAPAEQPLPGQPATPLQRLNLALYNVGQMAQRLLITMQAPTLQPLSGQPPVPQADLDEVARIIVQEVLNTAEEPQRIISSLSSSDQLHETPAPHQDAAEEQARYGDNARNVPQEAPRIRLTDQAPPALPVPVPAAQPPPAGVPTPDGEPAPPARRPHMRRRDPPSDL